ncbi:putative DNA-binding transcriptional regulator YafY [Natranaerovirga pectinivora]|uniref:Putative DNA-binding transcriptional regulator YafY n=1 Tax=Natranaerovirga pectinivora TaxID=682400 RepID=A0A4R3MEV1_9FIRM|nr:putative DNA-binding transcriptional regulator YafY [Natranaerovirga pectinivora]
MNRLFEIVYVLLSKGRVTAKELSERFEVSQRTIYRDIDALSIAGIPVYTEKGKGGGISLLPEFTLSQSLLTEQEQEEIISALQALEAVKPKETTKALTKLSAVFSRKAVNWIDVDFSDWSRGDNKLFSKLKTAIFDKIVVVFDYYSTKGEKTNRNVEPIQLFFKHRAWYLKGFCLSRLDIRLFKLTRMENLILTELGFTERNFSTILFESSQDEKNNNYIKLEVKILSEMAYRVYDEFEPQNIKKLMDGNFIATVVFPEDGWVYGYIMSFGEYIEVLEPLHIREIIQEKLDKALKKYI